MGDVIKQYNYKENFHKYFSKDDDNNVPLFGCEIEVDCGGENEEIQNMSKDEIRKMIEELE